MSEQHLSRAGETLSPYSFFEVVATQQECKELFKIIGHYSIARITGESRHRSPTEPDGAIYETEIGRNEHFQLRHRPNSTEVIYINGRNGGETFVIKDEAADDQIAPINKVKWLPSFTLKEKLNLETTSGAVALSDANNIELAEAAADLIHTRFMGVLSGFNWAIDKRKMKPEPRSFVDRLLRRQK